jgi:hypothetical protein
MQCGKIERVANFGGYILPYQFGVTGFYDVGCVWIGNEHADTWHQGFGGGLYFAPASLTVIQMMACHSGKGWYPFMNTSPCSKKISISYLLSSV